MGTIIIAPHVVDIIEYTASKLGLDKESKLFYAYSGALGFALTSIVRIPINYLAMHNTSELKDIVITSLAEAVLASVAFPLSIYAKKTTEHILGYTDSMKNLPNWIKKKKKKTKKNILKLGLGVSLLITGFIYGMSAKQDYDANKEMNPQYNQVQVIDNYLFDEYIKTEEKLNYSEN